MPLESTSEPDGTAVIPLESTSEPDGTARMYPVARLSWIETEGPVTGSGSGISKVRCRSSPSKLTDSPVERTFPEGPQDSRKVFGVCHASLSASEESIDARSWTEGLDSSRSTDDRRTTLGPTLPDGVAVVPVVDAVVAEMLLDKDSELVVLAGVHDRRDLRSTWEPFRFSPGGLHGSFRSANSSPKCFRSCSSI